MQRDDADPAPSAPIAIPGARFVVTRAAAAAAAGTPLAAALDAHEGVPPWDGGGGGGGGGGDQPPSAFARLSVAPSPRDLEPGGWVAGDVRETPPATRRSSAFAEALDGGDELAASVGRSAAVAVGDAIAADDADGAPGTSVGRDGLFGGEAAWWAASSGSIYPAFEPTPAGVADADALWAEVRATAAAVSAEPLLAAFVADTIGDADDLADALAAVLASRLAPGPAAEPGSQPPLLRRGTAAALLRPAVAADVAAAHYRRPPPRPSLAETLLFHDGLHALAAQRVAAGAWGGGAKGAALALQARVSQTLGADLHPGARLAPGAVIVHPLGVVIGEAAVVGPGAVVCGGVTLGGTGKERGDRHPKVGADVQIGVNATVLGNIALGPGCRVAAAALVLRAVPAGGLAAGSPAAVVGRVDEIGWDL